MLSWSNKKGLSHFQQQQSSQYYSKKKVMAYTFQQSADQQFFSQSNLPPAAEIKLISSMTKNDHAKSSTSGA